MALPPYVRPQEREVWLAVKAQPRARTTELAGTLGDELKIKVSAPPVDNAANEALVEFLAETLEIPRREVRLARGASTPHKLFAITGLSAEIVAQRLVAAQAR